MSELLTQVYDDVDEKALPIAEQSLLAGLIKLEKEFLNKDAYLAVKDNPAREMLSIFEVDSVEADASGGEPIFTHEGTPVGRVTSGAYGYSVGKSLAIGYADPNVAGPGDTVEIFILGQPHRAKILAEPPFDPKGHKLRDVQPVAEAV